VTIWAAERVGKERYIFSLCWEATEWMETVADNCKDALAVQTMFTLLHSKLKLAETLV